MIHLVKAEITDLQIISKLATTIWNAYYVSIIGKNQVDYMLNKMYNHQSLLQQVQEKKHVFYLIQQQTESIGFIAISTENNSDFFLHKFYIDQTLSNQGTGTKALQQLVQLIHPKTLTLTVNRQNFKSINFYFKNDFKIDRVEDFDIGDGYVMNDFVMIKIF